MNHVQIDPGFSHDIIDAQSEHARSREKARVEASCISSRSC